MKVAYFELRRAVLHYANKQSTPASAQCSLFIRTVRISLLNWQRSILIEDIPICFMGRVA
jgi:hypothetical protein